MSGSEAATAAKPGMPKPKVPEGNPAFNMMGLPKIRNWRLPSRNWCIFWAVVGTFAGSVTYDRFEKKKVLRRYTSMVSHLANEPLQPLQMPRKVRVFLGAPPGDGLYVARDAFDEYVKPIFYAAAVDYELVEGRMQGDIRHKTAQSIRDRRLGVDGMTDLQRQSKQQLEWNNEGGDLILGRHTFKEYIRGLHEGYLGPVEEPAEVHAIMNPEFPDQGAASPTEELEPGQELLTDAQKEEQIKAIKDKIPSSPPSYLLPNAYANAPDPVIDKPVVHSFVPLQHLLGFLNTPWRIWRFVHRRDLAESMCSATAATVLGLHSRPLTREDLSINEADELDWPKKNREKTDGVWVEDIAVDDRVMAHLARYELDVEEAERLASEAAARYAAESI
ncbi:mitochondrial import inner membrane translocase subunit Tim54 [Protomyces lactucae-debilis]|uniref:Mitochondrial import inner membrane translocase subunit TIM54 n=1 Tax=Protomyces lactucae-debilis TaxID=2754530 RepID=A0A1Y2FGT8_PROLT|nr:mitochondrial import inner membrane translocase subunit Tim54 [Protomyces lactucae-debilis]ORY83150.1 mitochondrial import inner membrane translocase subunit Tim54 [Protomyces lactucae-debilis]